MSGRVVLTDEMAMTLVPGAPAPQAEEWLPRAPVRLVPDSGASPRFESGVCARPSDAAPFTVSMLTALEEAGIDPALIAKFRTACRARGEAPRRVIERLLRSWLILDLAESTRTRRIDGGGR